MTDKRKVILDVDTGSDDAVAIILAVLSKKFDMLGITVTKGNCALEDCVENTLCVLELLGAEKDIPVFAGCPDAMAKHLRPERYMTVADVIHIVVDGVEMSVHPKHFELPYATAKPQKKHACAFIIDAIEASGEKVTIIATGPLTNIGMALRMKPSIIDNIEEIVVMGGAVGMGNITPVSEANFFNDPEAAKIVIDSGARVRIVGLNATHSAMFTRADTDVFEAIGTPASRFIAQQVRGRLDMAKLLGWGDGEEDAVHDALTVASVLDESVLTDVRAEKCDVALAEGIFDGQLVVDAAQTGKDHLTTVAYKADKQKFFDMLCEAVK